jgi:hypothetical protein
MENIFSKTERQMLASLVGEKFLCITGKNLGSELVSDEIVINTQNKELKLQGSLYESDFAGFADDYGKLKMALPTQEEKLFFSQDSDSFMHRYTSEINRVFIVRETLTKKSGTDIQWSYVSDVGVVFALDNGFVCCTLLSHGNELFVAEHKTNFLLDELEPTTSSFADDLFSTYETKREVIELGIQSD